jgi:hypothetical protein
MDAKMLDALIPIIAIICTFGFPVGIVYVWKFFKLKERELQVDAEVRKTSGAALEQRVQRLESIILALDSDLRQKLGAGPARAELMEPPPAAQHSQQPGPSIGNPVKTKQ